MRWFVPLLGVLLAGCAPDLTVTVASGVDAEPAMRRFLSQYQVPVKSVRSTDGGLAISFEGEVDDRTLGAVRTGLDHVIRAQPDAAPLVLALTDDEPEEIALQFDPKRGGVGLYNATRGMGQSSTLCAWEMPVSNLPMMGEGLAVDESAPPELQEALAGIADAINAAGLVRAHEFRLGDAAFDSGAQRVEFQDDRVLFVFDEKDEFGAGPIMAPPEKFFVCMRTVMRDASDPFVARIMFPTLSAGLQSYSTD